jgi:uncharacterized damage-inducible protein DinB
MTDILQKQYDLIRSSRQVVLNFIESEVGDGLNRPVPAYEGSTVRYLLVHNANTYFHWLAFFAMKTQFEFLDDENFPSIGLIRSQFAQVDELVAEFLKKLNEKMDVAISGTLSRNRQVSATPLQLFTHVTTHEFHHKGQIMTMCRLLGHIPPDTDVIRF